MNALKFIHCIMLVNFFFGLRHNRRDTLRSNACEVTPKSCKQMPPNSPDRKFMQHRFLWLSLGLDAYHAERRYLRSATFAANSSRNASGWTIAHTRTW